MVFTTHLFVFYFLPLVLALYYALHVSLRQAGQPYGRMELVLNGFLMAASYVFYGWWNPWFILLMLAVTVLNHVCGRIIDRPGLGPALKFWVVTWAIVASLATLGFFKYFTFFETNLNHVLAWSGAPTVRVLAITLPIGISFYTFHALSYTIDVYRGTAHRVRSFVDFACYIALFPQLVAGPIIRYNTVADQLVSRAHPGEIRIRGRAVHPGLRQEGLAGQSAGAGRGRRVQRRVARHAGRLVRRGGLRFPDLL